MSQLGVLSQPSCDGIKLRDRQKTFPIAPREEQRHTSKGGNTHAISFFSDTYLVSELGVMGKAARDGIKIRHTQPQALNDLPGLHHVVCVGLLNCFGVRPLAVGVEQVAFCRLDPPELDGVDVLCL